MKSVGYMQTVPKPSPEDDDIKKLSKDIDDMTPEKLAAEIRSLVLTSRQSRRHRGLIKKGDLRALASWEREITNNYGVKNDE